MNPPVESSRGLGTRCPSVRQPASQRLPRYRAHTGAGVSAASGVPTFRGPDGLWKSHRPRGIGHVGGVRTRPAPRVGMVRLATSADCCVRSEPGRTRCWPCGASAIHALTLITQNVDGLHERAGTLNVVRFHGSIWEVSCWNGCALSPRTWRDETVPYSEIPPRCPHCQGPLRPGVVWFGEGIHPEVLEICHTALDCDLFATVGTSSVVYPGRLVSAGGEASWGASRSR